MNSIHVDPTVSPTTVRWRRVAYALVGKLKETLLEMQKQEIIVPVTEPTSWVSNITVVEKYDGTLRRYLLRPTKSQYKAIRVPKYVIPKTDGIFVQLTNKKLFTVNDLKSGF